MAKRCTDSNTRPQNFQKIDELLPHQGKLNHSNIKQILKAHNSRINICFYGLLDYSRCTLPKAYTTSYISVGDFPKCFLKTVLKYPMEPKPHNSLTSVTVYLWLFNSSNA